jgi:20S proteasome alpha/beta subunit
MPLIVLPSGLQSILLSACLICSFLAAVSAGSSSPFDAAANVFAPDGTLQQTGFAGKAAVAGAVCVGLVCQDGVLLAARKPLSPSLKHLAPACCTRRINEVEKGIGVLTSGIQADGRALAHTLMSLAQQYKREWGDEVEVSILAQQLGAHLHDWSLRWSRRAYACTSILTDGLELWWIDHNGVLWRDASFFIGDGSLFLSECCNGVNWETLTCKQALHCLIQRTNESLPEDSPFYQWEAGMADAQSKRFEIVSDIQAR